MKIEDYNKTKLKQVIDAQSIAWNNKRVEERKGKKRSKYASDYGACMRKTWFQFFPEKYPTSDFDPRTLRIFHNGENVHERLSEYLRQEKSLGFKDEVDVPRDELQVHGRCDGICTVDEQAVIVEFKSINKKSVSEPKEEHRGQITWYMMMWQKLREDLKEEFGFERDAVVFEKDFEGRIASSGRTIDDLSEEERWIVFTQGEILGELIYESKQTQQTYHFQVKIDEEFAKKVRIWYEQLQWHIEKKERPNVRYDKSKFPCSWWYGSSQGRCAYFDECWGKD